MFLKEPSLFRRQGGISGRGGVAGGLSPEIGCRFTSDADGPGFVIPPGEPGAEAAFPFHFSRRSSAERDDGHSTANEVPSRANASLREDAPQGGLGGMVRLGMPLEELREPGVLGLARPRSVASPGVVPEKPGKVCGGRGRERRFGLRERCEGGDRNGNVAISGSVEGGDPFSQGVPLQFGHAPPGTNRDDDHTVRLADNGVVGVPVEQGERDAVVATTPVHERPCTVSRPHERMGAPRTNSTNRRDRRPQPGCPRRHAAWLSREQEADGADPGRRRRNDPAGVRCPAGFEERTVGARGVHAGFPKHAPCHAASCSRSTGTETGRVRSPNSCPKMRTKQSCQPHRLVNRIWVLALLLHPPPGVRSRNGLAVRS